MLCIHTGKDPDLKPWEAAASQCLELWRAAASQGRGCQAEVPKSANLPFPEPPPSPKTMDGPVL